MNITCPEMDLAVKLSEDSGNKVSEISFGWTKIDKIIFMASLLTTELKEQIESEITSLEYWSYEGDPHNAPDEGFMCNEHRVCISFPRIRQYPL